MYLLYNKRVNLFTQVHLKLCYPDKWRKHRKRTRVGTR